MHPGSKTVLNILHRFPPKENHSWKQKKWGKWIGQLMMYHLIFFKWWFFSVHAKFKFKKLLDLILLHGGYFPVLDR